MCQLSVRVLVVFLTLSHSLIDEFHETQNQDANRSKKISHDYDDIFQRRSEIGLIIKTVLQGQSLFKKQHIEGIVPTPTHLCPLGCHYVRRQGKCVHYLMPRIPC